MLLTFVIFFFKHDNVFELPKTKSQENKKKATLELAADALQATKNNRQHQKTDRIPKLPIDSDFLFFLTYAYVWSI